VDKIAYIMSRFPKLTETFILYEILAFEGRGITIEIFPLLRERQNISHTEAQSLAERAHYQPFISLKILAAQWYFIRRKPHAYFSALAEVLRGTFGSFNFFLAP
jgi:colanic acid/amylovoran biosynthesis glycosyltransferase